ncbi:uncharacterized protein [Melopsittacus undulatus]|uniref:uncharacterized protein n=1 Tax=Melopsittacus undulatus TaxID=13146 RepID=UPI00146EDB70|nr:uncharacterized protein LOC117437972 [Melopsittacus undulatus]
MAPHSLLSAPLRAAPGGTSVLRTAHSLPRRALRARPKAPRRAARARAREQVPNSRPRCTAQHPTAPHRSVPHRTVPYCTILTQAEPSPAAQVGEPRRGGERGAGEPSRSTRARGSSARSGVSGKAWLRARESERGEESWKERGCCEAETNRNCTAEDGSLARTPGRKGTQCLSQASPARNFTKLETFPRPSSRLWRKVRSSGRPRPAALRALPEGSSPGRVFRAVVAS